MIYTARQVEQIFKAHGQLVLPPNARLTPLAADWIRARKLSISWSAQSPAAQPSQAPAATPDASAGTPFLWWCDGPCGQAKAALSAFERSAGLAPLDVPSSESATIQAVRALAQSLREQKARGGIMLVRAAGAAMVFANRCPSIRAVLGTCLDAVDQAANTVGANVLVIEHPYKTFSQLRTLIGRFVRGPFAPSDAVQRQLQELSSCG